MEQSKFKSLIKRNMPVIVAFAIPFLIVVIIYIACGVYPFGDEMYMRSDSYHQYLPFMRAFQRAIQEGRSLNYMWEIGLGSNFASTYAYYLASPLNWVIALFPSTAVSAVMDFFIAFKCGLMGATFCYFVTQKFGKITYKATAVGIFYAMSSYMAAYSWNLMWLDCLVLLPLIMLGLERLVKERKVTLYTITLAVAVLSNYYIGIMVSIFVVIYFIYLLIADGSKPDGTRRTASDITKTILRFAWYSFISALMCMVTVLPAVFALSGTASADSTFPKTFMLYNEILELFSKGATLTEPAMFSGYFPNMYCTAAAFILIPLFWLNRKIALKKRIGLTLIIAFFLFSFNSNVLTYIWHGFHFPNGLPCRESFLLIAVVLLAAYEVLLNIEVYSKLTIIIVAGWGILANVIFYLLYKDKDFTLLSGLVTVGFIILYTVVLLFMNNRQFTKRVLLLMLLAICVGDAAFNTAYTGYGTAGYAYYISDNKAIRELLDSVDDGSFYRVEKVTRRTKNDGTWLDYKSASLFNSAALDGVTQFYKKMGMQSSMNAISYYGHTPLITMILGIKYEIAKEEQYDQLMNKVGHATYDDNMSDLYLYENTYVLGLGYTVAEGSQYNMQLSTSDPFKSQNEFVEATCGVKNLFTDNGTFSGVSACGEFKTSGRGMIYVSNRVEDIQVQVKRGDMIVLDKKFTDLENSQVVDIGEVEAGDTIIVEAVDSTYSGTSISVLTATMSYDKLNEVYNKLSKNQLDILNYDEGYVRGTITIEEGEELLTSIPCDEGWDIYVDGVKAVEVGEGLVDSDAPTYSKYLDAFLSVQMEPGYHDIEFRFKVPGQAPGFIITFLGILLFVFSLLMLWNSKGRRKIKLYRRECVFIDKIPYEKIEKHSKYEDEKAARDAEYEKFLEQLDERGLNRDELPQNSGLYLENDDINDDSMAKQSESDKNGFGDISANSGGSAEINEKISLQENYDSREETDEKVIDKAQDSQKEYDSNIITDITDSRKGNKKSVKKKHAGEDKPEKENTKKSSKIKIR